SQATDDRSQRPSQVVDNTVEQNILFLDLLCSWMCSNRSSLAFCTMDCCSAKSILGKAMHNIWCGPRHIADASSAYSLPSGSVSLHGPDLSCPVPWASQNGSASIRKYSRKGKTSPGRKPSD